MYVSVKPYEIVKSLQLKCCDISVSAAQILIDWVKSYPNHNLVGLYVGNCDFALRKMTSLYLGWPMDSQHQGPPLKLCARVINFLAAKIMAGRIQQAGGS